MKRIAIIAALILSIGVANADAATTSRAAIERVVAKEWHFRYDGTVTVSCKKTSKRHAQCIARTVLDGTCNEDGRWGVTVGTHRIALVERDIIRVSGQCPSVTITPK